MEKFQSSDLSRNPLKVFSAAESAPVLLTRRDGESLILMTESEAHSRDQYFELGQKIFEAALGDRGTLVERLTVAFPWMKTLNDDERNSCATDLTEAAQLSFASGHPKHLIIAMLSWKDTAYAISQGWSTDVLDWLDESIPVERPTRIDD